MLRGIDSSNLSEKDFDAYLAARLLSTDELERLSFRDMIKVRNSVRATILSSDTVRQRLRQSVEEALKGSAAVAKKSK